MRRVVVLVGIILVPLVLPLVPAASLFAEGWENGAAGWAFTGDTPGLSVNCGWGISGCSLGTDIHCCGTHSATRPLDIPLSGTSTTIVKVRFYNNLTANDAWPWIDLQFDQGSARLWINQAQQERFVLQTASASQVFGGPYSRFQWYEAQIQLRAESVMARFLGPAGEAWGDSSVFAIPGATRITSIGIGNEYHPNSQGRDTQYFFDDLLIYDTPACFPFSPTISVANVTREYPMDPGFTLGIVGGHASCPTTWSVDFGDGSSASGTGTPPTTLPHTYTAAGPFTAAFRVTGSGETRTTSTVVRPIECNPLTPVITAPFAQGNAPFDAQISTGIGSTLERCHALWRLDVGDGSPVLAGTSASPSDVAHTYTQVGVHLARFETVRGSESATATKYFTAGPFEQRANGSILAGVQTGSSVNLFQQHVAMIAPADGNDQFTLRWNATLPSDLDAFFTLGGARLAISGCLNENTFGVESCTIPKNADGFVVTARTAVNAVWEAHIKYA